MELRHARVLISGGTTGIGLAMASAFAGAGAEVLVCGRDPDRLADAGGSLGVRGIACDVTRPDDVDRLVMTVRGELGGLEVLVNNAGIQRGFDVMGAPALADAEAEVATNLVAPLRLTCATLPLLLASDRAAIVNVTSALAIAPKKSAPMYCATKAALRSLTRTLSYQLRETAVQVMEVVPPLVATAMTAGRDDGAIGPDRVAAATVRGLRRDKSRVLVGKSRVLSVIDRVSPALAARIMRDR